MVLDKPIFSLNDTEGGINQEWGTPSKRRRKLTNWSASIIRNSRLPRILPSNSVKLARSNSEPSPDPKLGDEAQQPDLYLTVQSLASVGKGTNASGFPYPPTLRATPHHGLSPIPEGPIAEQYDDFLRHLANRSTLSISSKGREVRVAPAFLQQFELSRQCSLSSSAGHEPPRQMAVTEGIIPTTDQQPNKFRKVAGEILSRHRIIGLRHILLFLLLAFYAIGGMFLFYAIEVPFERQSVAETLDSLNEALETLSKEFETAGTLPDANISALLKQAYITLIKIDGKYTGSTFYKLEERDYPQWTWTYGTSFFFAFSLYSTVGYGSIAPSTVGGRVAVIVYIAVGFPLALVVVRDLGAVTMVFVTKLYAAVVMKIRTIACFKRRFSTSDDIITVPIIVATAISILCLLLTAVVVMLYDASVGPDPGLDFFHSFYFSFLSHTAVGLGDIMPVNYANSPVVACILLLGMPLMRVINRVLYVGMERRMYGALIFVENSLDRVAPAKRGVVEGEENVEIGAKSGIISTVARREN